MPIKNVYDSYINRHMCPQCNRVHSDETVYCEKCLLRNRLESRIKRTGSSEKITVCVDCGFVLSYSFNRPLRCRSCAHTRNLSKIRQRRAASRSPKQTKEKKLKEESHVNRPAQKEVVKSQKEPKSVVSNIPAHKSWVRMKSRCLYPCSPDYHRYGARGICFCSGLETFQSFYSILGDRPDGCSLDRIDNNGNYSCGECSQCIENSWPLNVRWANNKTQSNNRRSNHLITFNDRTQTISEWAREVGISPAVLSSRILSGWTPENAITIPLRKSRS